MDIHINQNDDVCERRKSVQNKIDELKALIGQETYEKVKHNRQLMTYASILLNDIHGYMDIDPNLLNAHETIVLILDTYPELSDRICIDNYENPLQFKAYVSDVITALDNENIELMGESVDQAIGLFDEIHSIGAKFCLTKTKSIQ